ncbi:MAG: flavodoxin family protein [Thermaerobacterales bacterium]
MPWNNTPIPNQSAVLALQGSPRDGNTVKALHDVVEGLAVPADIWDLEERPVLPIGDCAVCEQRGRCSRDDAFDRLYPSMVSAPLLILGSPLYWYGVSAQLKAFLDRWSCGLHTDDRRFRNLMRGKPVAVVSPQADPDLSVGQPLIDSIRLTCDFMDMRFVGALQLVAKGRDDLSHAEPARRQAVEFGRTLRAYLP